MTIKSELGIKYDPKHDMKYGYWRCGECSNEFYGGGEALHDKNCSAKNNGAWGYGSCVYHFGPEEVKITKEASVSPYCGRLTIETLAKFFPHLLKK